MVSLHMKGMDPEELFSIFRHQLMLVSAVPSSVRKTPGCQGVKNKDKFITDKKICSLLFLFAGYLPSLEHEDPIIL